MDPVAGAKRTTATSNRAESKCESCRSRKIKCLPEERNFSTGERCLACQKSRLPCGPNTVKLRVRNAPRVPNTTDQIQEEGTQPLSTFGGGQLGPRPRAVLIQQHAISQSSSATPSLIYHPPDSPDESERPEPLNVEYSVYEKSRRRLSKMGWLIDLCRFIQHRHKALIAMQEAAPLLSKITETEAPLNFFLQKTGDMITGYFLQVDSFRRSLVFGSAEWEIICRRMVITGQLFLDLHNSGPDFGNVTESFRNAHANLKEQLYDYYQRIGDSTEADRLRFQTIESGEYLANCPVQTLVQVASRISSAMKSVLEHLPSKYKDQLNLEEPVEITASHLTLMASHFNESIDLNECPPSGGTGLTGRNSYHLAAEVGNGEYLRHHLTRSSDATARFLSARDIFGLTPIMIAAYSGNLEVFQILSEHGASLKEQTPDGKSVLSLSCMAGHIPIVRYILNKKVRIQDHIRYCSPLHDAIEAGRRGVVEYLIQSGAASPNTIFHEWTAVEWAEKCSHPELASILVSNNLRHSTEGSHRASVRAGKRKRSDRTSSGEDHNESTHRSTEQDTEFVDFELMLAQPNAYGGQIAAADFTTPSQSEDLYFGAWSDQNFDQLSEPGESSSRFYLTRNY